MLLGWLALQSYVAHCWHLRQGSSSRCWNCWWARVATDSRYPPICGLGLVQPGFAARGTFSILVWNVSILVCSFQHYARRRFSSPSFGAHPRIPGTFRDMLGSSWNVLPSGHPSLIMTLVQTFVCTSELPIFREHSASWDANQKPDPTLAGACQPRR